MSEYINYQDIIKHLDIQPGDKLIIGSDVTKLAIMALKNKEKFDPNKFIDSIINVLGDKGTLLLPTYNWGYCNNQIFDYHHTKSETGILTNIALKRSDFKRTKHPIYSFAVWGKDQNFLYSMENKSSFGKDSPFAYLHKQNAKMLIIGLDYQRSFTFVHYVEENEKVPYRYLKDFKSVYIDEKGKESRRTYSMCVRDLDMGVITRINPMGILMEKNGVSFKRVINQVPFISVDLNPAYDLIKKEIAENNGERLFTTESNLMLKGEKI